MALAKGMGPGGRIARAENKVDKAKDKLGKAVSKYRIASTDSPSEYYKKKDNQAKGDVKVGKAVAKVDKAKAKVDKVVGKVAGKVMKKVLPKKFVADDVEVKAAKNYLKSKMK